MNRAQFIQYIKNWADRDDWSDSLVGSFIDMANSELSMSLRVGDMIKTSTGYINSCASAMPDDWEETDLIIGPNGTLKYATRDDFYSLPEKERSGFFTMVGRSAHFGSYGDGSPITVSYYASIPPLGEEGNWTTKRYLSIFLFKALSFGSAYDVDEGRAALAESEASRRVELANEAYKIAKHSGSSLVVKRKKSF